MDVTRDMIYGFLSVYLLIAITWGYAYLLLVAIQPDALRIDAVRGSNHNIDLADCMLYSLVTLTSSAEKSYRCPRKRSRSPFWKMSGGFFTSECLWRAWLAFTLHRFQRAAPSSLRS
jgi:hypothetical protein